MNKETLVSSLKLRGIECSNDQANLLIDFMHSVLETNKSFNLTAIKEESEFLEKMIFDSALPLVGNSFEGMKIIDVGTGAGFPGVVLNILNPKTDLTLLDSTAKKINFLKEYGNQNELTYSCVCERAEIFSRNNREKYDYAFARAVAPLNILLELIMPLLKVGGIFMALKGPGSEKEIEQSRLAFKKLGCRLQKVYVDNLPESDEYRTIISIQKVKETHNKYPRDYKDIKKLPL